MLELARAGASKSGQSVNWRTALQAATAFACARVIAEGIAQVPHKVFQLGDGGKRRVATDHPLHPLISLKPNALQTAFEFHEQIALHLVFCGNAFVFKNRIGSRIVELLPYEPQSVRVKHERIGERPRYAVVLDDGREVPVPAEDIWHLRGPSWNGWMGLEGVRIAREAIGLSLATEEHGARLFQNGATLGGVLTTDQNLTTEQRDLIRKSWEARHAGAENAYRTGILWGGLKWQPMGSSNVDAQYLEVRRFQVEEVCRAFRVLPIMVGHADKTATYASAEQMFLAHTVYTMIPWYRRLEQATDADLLTERDRREGYYTKLVDQALMRGSMDARANYAVKMYGIGALSPNEIRELDERDPYEGGERFRVPLNMVDPTQPDEPPADSGARPDAEQ